MSRYTTRIYISYKLQVHTSSLEVNSVAWTLLASRESLGLGQVSYFMRICASVANGSAFFALGTLFLHTTANQVF